VLVSTCHHDAAVTSAVLGGRAEGDYSCPVTGKVFTAHSHIVALKTTGNVYSYDAVDELCIKPKNWKVGGCCCCGGPYRGMGEIWG